MKKELLKKSDSISFFKLKEDDFPWEGVIKIKGQSIIANSELLDRTTTIEMANLVIPLFATPREIAEKPAREIIKAYNKEPEDWLPEAWLQPAPPPQAPAAPELFSEAGAAPVEEEKTPPMVDIAGGVKSQVPAEKNLANSMMNMGK